MNDERLIEVVREFPCLYDKANKDFKDQYKKKAAWMEVGKRLGVDDNVAMKRWGNLRERYTKEIRNSKRDSGSGAVHGRQWGLLESLEFLRAHIVPRPMRQSAQIVESANSESLFCESQLSCNPSPLAQSSPIRAEPSPMSPVDLSALPATQSPTMPPAETSPIPPGVPSTSRGRKRAADQRDEMDAAIIDTIKTFKEVCERKARREDCSSDVRGFGMMMCSAISKLKQPKQAVVMQRCTEIVMQAQIEEHDEMQFIELCYEPTS